MTAWEQEKEELGKELLQLGYESNCIQTIFNTKDPSKRKQGWILKNGTNSIYFINFRNAPGAPKFLTKLGYLMGRTAVEEIPEAERDWFIGVDMAGIPVAAAMAVAYYNATGEELRTGYTRPFTTKKIRTVEEVEKELATLKENLEAIGKWGAHRLVEAEIEDNQYHVVTDDMVTGSESKQIARKVIDFDIVQRGMTGTVKHVLVGIDRMQGAEAALEAAGMYLHRAAPMRFEWLEGAMPANQYEHLARFVEDTSQYQDVGRDPKTDKKKGESSPLMKEALELARKVA